MKRICFICFLSLIMLQLFAFSAYGIAAKFTCVKRSNCAPALVEFVNTSSSGSGITYTWNFGLGAIVTTSDITAKEQLYLTSGKYRVSLIVRDGIHTDSMSTILVISNGPTAKLDAVPVAGCAPLLVHFTSNAVQGDSSIVKTLWDFRDGQSASGTTTKFTYTNAGRYDIVLKVIDKNGCYSVMESDSFIQVVKKPSVSFIASDTFACSPPLNVSYTNLTSGSSELTYLWDYGNGKTSTDLSNSSIYTLKGKYNVKLIAKDVYGCTDSMVKMSYISIGNETGSMVVYNSKNQLVNTSKLCPGTYNFVFSITNLPDYTWIIRDNNQSSTIVGKSSLSYVVKDTGNLVVELTYGKNSSCTDIITKSFSKSTVKSPFILDPSFYCSLPQKIKLQNLSSSLGSSSWYLSNRYISGNSDTVFTITKNELPSQTYQQLYSHDLNTQQLPISLVTKNVDGCSDSVTQTLQISFPQARFIADKVSGCSPLLVSFSDSSKSTGKIDKYVFKVGNDSVTSPVKSIVKYTFTKPGEYFVSEIIRSGTCIDTAVAVKIIVGTKLKPDFTVTPAEVCNGGKIHLTGNSDNNAVVRSWQFNALNIFNYNFTTRPDTSITIFTDTAGYKNISLRVDYNGCFSDTTKKAIFKVMGPIGDFTDSFTCIQPLLYYFKSKISPVTSLSWNIDTASYSNVDTLHYRFKTSGNYTAKLTATDNSSKCTLTRTKLIQVRQVKAAFTVNDTLFCAGDTAHLNGLSSKDYISNCYNEGFLWDFGDNTPARRTFSTSYDHIYSVKGKYKLLLVVKADNGCVDSIKKNVQVFKPVANFTTDKDSGCLPKLTVTFNYASSDTTIIKWTWNFGDNITDDSKKVNIAHLYSTTINKTYNSTLTVYDSHQCYGTFSVPITLFGINTDFQADDNAICLGQPITFTPVDKTLDSLLWNYGDGSSSTGTNIHTYAQKGIYTVSVTASKNGCRDTISKINYIRVENAEANFQMSDSIFSCYPDTVFFIRLAMNGSDVVDRLWTFNAHALTGSNRDSVNYVFTKPGTYAANLKVITLNGCEATRTKHVVISGPSAMVSFDPKKICYNDLVNFKVDSLKNVTDWKLLFGDGSTSIVTPVSHRYSSRGNLVPSIVLTNSNCMVTNVLDTVFISKVKADFYHAGDSILCLNSKSSFLNRSVYSTSWIWSVDKVQTTEYNLGEVSFGKIGDYTVKLIALDDNTCSDTLSKKYTVIANPVFTILGDSILCSGKDSILLSVNKNSGWTIKWTPSTGLSDAVAFSTIASPSATITYLALVTDQHGCTASQGKKIIVNQPADYSRIPLADTTIIIGATIQLKVLTEAEKVSYSWSPNYNISCLNCNDPYVSPTQNTTYKVEVKNGCFDFIENFTIKILIDFYLEAPSAFTPNGDQNNDVYKFEANEIQYFDLKIFNRWGEIVYSSTNVLEGWDGKINGHPQNIDTYTYFVKAESAHGYKFEKKGTFLLLK